MKSMKHSKALLIDAIINIFLGMVLLSYSPFVIRLFGLPSADHYFYPNILGAVLFGIGLALIVEYRRKDSSFVGLGLGGAVAINVCGGLVLASWLVFGNMALPAVGRIILWVLVVILLGLSALEYYFQKTLDGGSQAHK
jgi:hypothetical protein